MRSIHETFETFGNRILNLGRSGESRRVTVYVDLSKIVNEYPNTSPILKVRAPGTTNAYPAATDYRDGLMAWIEKAEVTRKEAEEAGKKALEAILSVGEAKDNVIYMVAKKTANGNNAYDEYMLVNGKLERIGDTQADIGILSNDDIDALINEA